MLRPMQSGRASSTGITKKEASLIHAMQGVPIDTVWNLLKNCPLVEFDAGEVVLHRGQANERMHFVLEGLLSVRISSAAYESVAMIAVGEAVGELSVIDKKPASTFVITEAPSRLLAIDERMFWQLAEVSHAFSRNMLKELASRVRTGNVSLGAQLEARERLEFDAMIDALTGVYNRRWINDRLARLVARTHRDHRTISLLMLDVDHFKRCNDTYGHAAGDAVLAAVARTIVACMRPTDLVARFGGEEFVVALPTTDLEGARLAAERLRRAVNAVEVRDTEGEILPPMTVSIGVVESDGESGIDALLARADSLLYAAKRNGRDRVEHALSSPPKA